MKHSLFILLAAAMIVACKPQDSASAQQPSPSTTAPNNTGNLVKLETGGCRGFCPMYKLTFRNDGALEYIGTRHVEKVGIELVRLTPEEFSRLLKEVRRVNLWQYPAEIPSTVVDAPVHTFTVFEGSKTHTVKGTAGIPKPIMALEALMQDIAEAHGLPVKKGVDPSNSPTLKGQVIVKFKMEVNARNFCNQFSDIKVRTVEHLSEDNTWIIGYNPSELTEDQFISLLKDMEGVLEVEPNKQAKERN